jgi:hypothetical protein
VLADRVEPGTRLDRDRAEDFLADLARATGGRCDSELAGTVVGNSRETVGWLTDQVPEDSPDEVRGRRFSGSPAG